jgi:ribosomal protein S18 acetylase RimI-like enzyme
VAEFITRTYQPDDAAAVTDLWNDLRIACGGQPAYTAEETRAITAALVADPATDTRLVVEPGGRIVAAAMVGSPPAGGFRVDLFGGVHPDRRSRGLGRELLSWQVDRARAIHAATAPDAEWVAETAAMVADTSAIRLAERFGFTPVRYFFDMTAPTKQAPTAALPAGLRSEPFRADLGEALHEAHMEAFIDHWGYQRREFAAWKTFTIEAEGFRADLSRIVFDGADIAAYLLSYDDALPDRLYIGQVGTRRAWRRRGLAGALLVEVLAAAGAAGLDFATLGVDADSPTGAVGVYERAGFEIENRDVAHHLRLR